MTVTQKTHKIDNVVDNIFFQFIMDNMIEFIGVAEISTRINMWTSVCTINKTTILYMHGLTRHDASDDDIKPIITVRHTTAFIVYPSYRLYLSQPYHSGLQIFLSTIYRDVVNTN